MRLELFFVAMLASAGPPVIGTVVARGSFQLDNSVVTGNATLFEGVSIETNTAGSTMQLSSGVSLLLGPQSKGRFFGDHAVLERGEIEGGFRFLALGLTIQPNSVESSARVAITGETRVRVAALSGSLQVLNASGALVAKVSPDKTLELEPQVSEVFSRLWGCLHQIGTHFILVDDTTNVVVELGGPGLEKEATNRVDVTASVDSKVKPVFDATQFLSVISIKRVNKGCKSGNKIAAAAGAGGLGAGGAAAGTSGGAGGAAGGAAAGGAAAGAAGIAAPIAVVSGIAAAATAGGLAAAGKLPGQESPPPISR